MKHEEKSFNPRSYERSDGSGLLLATGGFMFQSTLLRKERPGFQIPVALTSVFQSTLLRKERRISLLPGQIYTDFNPRSYERSDKGIGFFCAESKSFNPRSYERSDQRKVDTKGANMRFQSTLLRKERHKYRRLSMYCDEVSIHAPTKGATSMNRTGSYSHMFQSTLLRKERLSELSGRAPDQCFNPRSYERSDIKRY